MKAFTWTWSDKPSIIIIIHLDLDTWIVPGQIRKANLCRGLGNRYTPAGTEVSVVAHNAPIVVHSTLQKHVKSLFFSYANPLVSRHGVRHAHFQAVLVRASARGSGRATS